MYTSKKNWSQRPSKEVLFVIAALQFDSFFLWKDFCVSPESSKTFIYTNLVLSKDPLKINTIVLFHRCTHLYHFFSETEQILLQHSKIAGLLGGKATAVRRSHVMAPSFFVDNEIVIAKCTAISNATHASSVWTEYLPDFMNQSVESSMDACPCQVGKLLMDNKIALILGVLLCFFAQISWRK